MTRNMDSIDVKNITPPELKLVQNVGGEDAKASGALPGNLFCPQTREIFKSGVDGVVVDMVRTRTYWGRDGISDGPPACSCANADVPNASGVLGECAKCQNNFENPWELSADDRKSICLVSWTILMITKDTLSPYMIRAGGISATPAKNLWSSIRMNRNLKVLGLHRGLFHFGSEKRKTASGEAYMWTFQPLGILEAEKAQDLRALSSTLLGSTDWNDVPQEIAAGEKKALPAPLPETPKMGSPVVEPKGQQIKIEIPDF